MKRKNLKTGLASLVVFLLVGVMSVGAAFTAFTGTENSIAPNLSTNSAIQSSSSNVNFDNIVDHDLELGYTRTVSKTDKIGMIIEMNETTLIDTYLADPSGYATFAEYRMSEEGKLAAEILKNKQNALFNKIARQADVKLKYNYVSVMNGFAIEITYGDRDLIDKIAARSNVLSTMLSKHYDAPEIQAVENQVSADANTGIFDSAKSQSEGYGGQGTIVGVLDTGLDWEHVAFDPNHELFKLEEQLEEGTLRYTYYAEDEEGKNGKEDIADYISELTAKKLFVNDLTATDVFKNYKVPYAFDYADGNPEVSTHLENEHGTHVAGIIAGHSDDPFRSIREDETKGKVYLKAREVNSEGKRYYQNVDGKRVYSDLTDADVEVIKDKDDKDIIGITGVAPQAQLAIFKVFGDYNIGAESIYLLAALEDCITLNLDVVNMSLGAENGFAEDAGSRDSVYEAYDKMGKVGISLVVAASNAYSSGTNSHYGLNLKSNPDSGTIGTPAAYEPAFTVASISGKKSKYITAVNESGNELGVAYYTDSVKMNNKYHDFMKEIYDVIEARPDLKAKYYDEETGALKIPYATIPGVGKSSDYAGINVTDKIALVARGTTNFDDKIKEAAQKRAIACIVYNNAAGVISMQVEDDVPIPSCSITMDESSTIRYQDTNGNAYFVIDDNEEKQGGPFMSEFSSWGPLPNLLLKPEITAHGGEIYSAVPGDETAYARISGTSMACPNMAGVVAIMRQYMQNPDDNYAMGRKYGVMNADGNAIDLNLMERRIYQLLMSTATIANNEQGNPYSPRKQGAGLADLETARKAEQYLYVTDKKGNEKERTKLELFDDPERKGVYTMEFYVKNVSENDVEYSVDAYVMTEGISSDNKTVSEKSRMLTATDQVKTLKVEGNVQADGKVTVKAGQTVKLGYEIKLGEADKEWLANFINGMYVEGFVCLENISENGSDLNIPYLAFYGDWEDAPILDYDIYETTADENDDGIKEDDKRYTNAMALTLVGKLMQDGTEYSFGMGRYTFNIPKDDYGEDLFEMPDAEEDKCALSYNSDSGLCGLYAVGGFLRGAKLLFWRITDATSGAVIKEDCYLAARKSSTSNIGGAWIELDLNERDFNLINNHKYNFELYPVLDWKYERFIVRNSDKSINVGESIKKVVEYNEEYNAEKPEELKRRYTWSSDFWIDTDAPFISDAKIRVIRDNQDNASYYLDLYVTDNHYVQAIGLNVFSKDKRKFVSLFGADADIDDTVRPVLTARNATTYLTYNITRWWDQIKDGLLYRMNNVQSAIDANPELGTYLTRFQVTLFDYAFNSSYYNIDVMSLMPSVKELEFGEIGNYKSFANKEDSSQPSIEVLTSVNKNIEKDANGSYRPMRSEINLIPGQRVELMRSIIANPSDAWREDYAFESTLEDVVKVDQKTGEIYANGPGEAVITLRSKTTGISTTLKVNVLSQEKINTYGITGIKLGEQRLNGLEFKGTAYKKFNAGEKYLVEIEHQPWYMDFDSENYFIKWDTSNSTVAWTEEYEEAGEANTFKRWIVANDSSVDKDGKYVENSNTDDLQSTVTITATLCEWNDNGSYLDTETNKHYTTTFYTATFQLEVYEEFVVSGGELKEYHGTPKEGRVIIPDTLDITSIAGNLFYKRDDITFIQFPEGLEKIGWAACAYMPNLEEVIFPSTLQMLDGYSFAAHFTANAAGPNTKLSIVDMSKCLRPIQVCAYAFAQQRYIGLDMKQTVIVDPAETALTSGIKNTIVPLSEEQAARFDTKMVRYAGDYAFYGMEYVKHLDLTNLRGTGVAPFYKIGSSLRKYFTNETDKYTSIKFGPDTTFGVAAFGSNGIGEIEIPMSRIMSQAFYGATTDDLNNVSGEVNRPEENEDEESDDNEEDVPEGLYFGELKKITFTGDNLVIGSLAFAFSSVEEVVFDCDVEYIGESAFVYSKLNKVTFKHTCRKIGANAFYRTELKEFTMPDGLESLGSAALAFCDKLTTVKADANCKALIPENVNDETASFHGCDNLESFEITGNGYLSSKEGVLYGNNGATLLSVPCNKNITKASEVLEGVTTIGTYAFAGNIHLQEADLGDFTELTQIGSGAFSLCKKLTKVTLPNIDKINDTMFYDCENLVNIDMSKATELTEIGATAFYNTGLTEFDTPSTVTKLGIGAFAECQNLESVKLSMGIKILPEALFFDCKKLESVTLKMIDGSESKSGELVTITEVGAQAFTFTGLSSIRLITCKTIGDSAFAACEKLTSVDLPAVTHIGDYAFFAESEADEDDNLISNGAITSLIIPKVTYIGKFAFSAQDKFSRVNIRECKVVDESAFFGCYGLNDLQMYYIEEIYANAFANTSVTLEDVVFLDTFKYMHPSAFVNSKVREYSISDGNPNYYTYGGAIYRDIEGGYELVSVPTSWQSDMTFDIREGTIRISEYAFSFSEWLVKVNIPDSVRTIGDSAFYGSSIKVYNFNTLTAPELETTYGYIDTTYDKYFWQIYNNFYMPFNFPYDKFGGAYKYLSIRQTTEDDYIMGITENVPLQNFYYTEADSDRYAFTGAWYGIILCRPSNATGFDDSNFIWKHYFDNVMLMPELLEQSTQNVMDLITALPEAEKLTESSDVDVKRARALYDTITSYQQRAFVVNAGLVDKLVACENKLAELTAAKQSPVTEVVELIEDLPAVAELTLEDENAVKAARSAYNALSSANKTLFDADNKLALEKLEACEARIEELKEENNKSGQSNDGCGSCGTVTFGSSGGGTGLTIGLGIVLLSVALAVLLRKRKVQSK